MPNSTNSKCGKLRCVLVETRQSSGHRSRISTRENGRMHPQNPHPCIVRRHTPAGGGVLDTALSSPRSLRGGETAVEKAAHRPTLDGGEGQVGCTVSDNWISTVRSMDSLGTSALHKSGSPNMMMAKRNTSPAKSSSHPPKRQNHLLHRTHPHGSGHRHCNTPGLIGVNTQRAYLAAISHSCLENRPRNPTQISK